MIEEMEERVRLHPEKLDANRNIVEKPFGTMKRAFNQDCRFLRGLRRSGGEVGFTMLECNMWRIINIWGISLLSYFNPRFYTVSTRICATFFSL